jgi:hypothetical protein
VNWLETRVGIEPPNKGFADLAITVSTHFVSVLNPVEAEFCPALARMAARYSSFDIVAIRTDSSATATSTPSVSPRASTWRRPSRSDASRGSEPGSGGDHRGGGAHPADRLVNLANLLLAFCADYSPLAIRRDLLCQTVVSANYRMGDDPGTTRKELLSGAWFAVV